MNEVYIVQVKEAEMMTIVYSLLQLNYVDNKLINSLEKVIKHRGCQVYNTEFSNLLH